MSTSVKSCFRPEAVLWMNTLPRSSLSRIPFNCPATTKQPEKIILSCRYILKHTNPHSLTDLKPLYRKDLQVLMIKSVADITSDTSGPSTTNSTQSTSNVAPRLKPCLGDTFSARYLPHPATTETRLSRLPSISCCDS